MTETVSVQEPEKVLEQPVAAEINEQPEVAEVQETENNAAEEIKEEQKVPLSALQKERRKRQELEMENKYLKEYARPAPAANQVPDDTQYEAVTKGEMESKFTKERLETIRLAEERLWIKENPEKAELVNEKLPEFLKQRPNMAQAIEAASNRYEEAWELMDKLTPKQKMALKNTASVKKDAPNSPSSVPKAAALNQAVDCMSMTDAEFRQWRNSIRKK